jgi:hypothetical protein
MRARHPLLAVVAAIFAGFVLAAHAEEEPPALRALGKVKSIDDDGKALDLEAKGGPFRVDLPAQGGVSQLKLGPVTGLEGSRTHVLGKEISGGRQPGGGNVPPSIGNIITIVVGEFTPPPLRADLTAKKIAWLSGFLTIQGNQLRLDAKVINTGVDRPIVQLVPADRSRIAKGLLLHVDGRVEGDPKAKPRRLRATAVTIVDPKIPEAELREILGL